MTTPLCHKTLERHYSGSTIELTGLPCIGSRCAAWVPRGANFSLTDPLVEGIDQDTGLGFCGLTMDGQEFPDPAAQPKPATSPLTIPTADLDVTVRTANFLANSRIATVGELVQYSKLDLVGMSLHSRGLGELRAVLDDMGLSLKGDEPKP